MSFFIIDYSFVYFENIMKVSIPPKRDGKFVQIINEVEQKEYLALSPRELSTYHASIVERFCRLNNIDGQYNSKRDIFYISNPGWEVSGGGMFTIDDTEMVLRLYGESAAYGKFPADGLKYRIGSSGQLQGYNLIIE